MPPRAPLLTSVAASVLGLLLIGCGGGDGTTTVVERETVTEASGGGQDTTEAEPSAASGVETPEPPTETVELEAFRSPSGNIGCQVGGGTARCDIAQREWSPPPRPASCPPETDYGQGLEVRAGDGPGGVVCAGDTALDPRAPTLAYGTASSVGSLVCTSRETGITCVDVSEYHGFFMSRNRYRTF
jgi:Family of unknown function (DUF6636)